MSERARGMFITFASNFIAEADGVDWDGIERAAIETTHLRTPLNSVNGTDTDAAAKTFIPSDVMDFGELTVSLYHNSDTRPPIDKVEETMLLRAAVPRNKTTGASYQGTAFLTGYSMKYKLGDKTMATAKIKWSGPVAFTASS